MLAPARAPTGALVGEMAGSSQVHGDAGFRRRRGHLVIAHRAPGVHDRLYSRACQRLQSIREGEERIGGCDRTTDPVAAAFDGQPVAPSAAITIAFDLTARHERHAKTKSVNVAGSAGDPVASVQFAGLSPCASSSSRC